MHKVYEKDKCAYMFQVNKNKMIIDIQSHGAPKLNFVGSVCVIDFNCDVTAHALGGYLVNRKCCCSFTLLFQQVSMICSFYFCHDCGQCLRCTIYGFLLWSQTASGEVYTVQGLLQLRPKASLVWNKMKKSYSDHDQHIVLRPHRRGRMDVDLSTVAIHCSKTVTTAASDTRKNTQKGILI